ncbi:TnpV protein [Eubacteriales bacterium OttesenSCG-928-K08]|nr:TnpV protein [Eubacteriales bacterium OttesenSCG-928-K08]
MNNLMTIQTGDYRIPALTLSQQPELEIGKYGQMRKRYLKEQKPAIYSHMLLMETLYPHLLEINQMVSEQVKQSEARMAQAEGVTEALKQSDQMEWVQRMNNIRHRAEELVITEIIYS